MNKLKLIIVAKKWNPIFHEYDDDEDQKSTPVDKHPGCEKCGSQIFKEIDRGPAMDGDPSYITYQCENGHTWSES